MTQNVLKALFAVVLLMAGPSLTGAQLAVTPTDEHVFRFAKLPKDFATRVALQGGEVIRTHPEVGLAIVRGLSDAGAQVVGKNGNYARDLTAQFISAPGDIAAATRETESGAAQGHDPAAATLFGSQWNLHIIDADRAWAAGFDDASGVTVAVLDTGIDPLHQDLAGLVDAARSVAFVPSVNGAGPIWGDDNFHGTHVASTIASNGIGTSGVAPHATLVAVKVCSYAGRCPFAAIISGIVYAANIGADVVNLSLGGSFAKAGQGFFVGVINKAINYAAARGTLVVSAAANDAVDLDHNGNLMAWPCEGGNGLCVSATGPTDAAASYTNYGRSAISVAAPGGDFDGDLAGSTVLAPCSSLSVLPGFDTYCAGGSAYLNLQGTSMAAPHVAGAAALLDAQFAGGLNAAQLRAALQQSADDLGKKGADPFYGKGRINVLSLLAQ